MKYSLYLLIFFPLFLFGQDEIEIEDIPNRSQMMQLNYNAESNVLDKELPFDRFFTLIIESKEYKISNGGHAVFEGKLKKSGVLDLDLMNLKGLEENKGENKRKKVKPFYNNLKAKKISENKYEIIIPPLEPHKLYFIIINKSYGNKDLAKFSNVLYLLNLDKIEEAEELYGNVYRIEEQPYRSIDFGITPTFDEFKNTEFKEYALIDSLESVKINYSDEKLKEFAATYANLVKKYELNFNRFYSIISAFKDNVPGDGVESLSLGLSNFYNKSKIKPHDLFARISNIETNKKEIDTLLQIINKVELLENINSSEEFKEEYINPLQTSFERNLKILNSINKEIKSTLNNRGFAEVISASTSAKNPQVRNAQYLVGDFGLTNGLMYNSKDDNFNYIPRPYFGVNWHIGGIDKNLELSQIPNYRFWQRASIAIGITVGKIDEGPFEDLYNGLSPMVGLNFRLTEQVRLGVGGLIVRENDPNPILDESNVIIGPYSSISFDINLFSEIGKLSGLIFK